MPSRVDPHNVLYGRNAFYGLINLDHLAHRRNPLALPGPNMASFRTLLCLHSQSLKQGLEERGGRRHIAFSISRNRVFCRVLVAQFRLRKQCWHGVLHCQGSALHLGLFLPENPAGVPVFKELRRRHKVGGLLTILWTGRHIGIGRVRSGCEGTCITRFTTIRLPASSSSAILAEASILESAIDSTDHLSCATWRSRTIQIEISFCGNTLDRVWFLH